MKYQTIPHTDLKVSKICLGTMTYGEQNIEAEAHQQLNYALEKGVNFIDTAELYPVPPKAETQGLTEQYIGTWLVQQRREDIILASKVAGPMGVGSHIRGGSRFNRTHITQALEDSLKRLQTDYLDLYQLHWPERSTNFFGQLGYKTPTQTQQRIEIVETLEVLNDLVQAGKIRHIGLSNETAWGLSQFLKYAEIKDLCRVISVQNPYSLLNRSYELSMAEFAYEEGIGLLAYSPLAFGVLSGKYLNDMPKDGRITLYPRFSRYTNPQGVAATQAYVDIAHNYGLDPAQMALAFVTQQPFVYSNIIGATTMTQLASNIASIELTLSDEILAEIEAVHQRYTYPCP